MENTFTVPDYPGGLIMQIDLMEDYRLICKKRNGLWS